MKRCSPQGLPDLAQLELASSCLADRSTSIQSLLRRVAEENRNGHLQVFYSIRSVADHFAVPSATISRIYRQLSAERILRIIWGSKTLLEPRTPSGSSHCKSIGIPVKLGLFIDSADYRNTILQLQSEIWNHDVDERLLFLRNGGEEIVELCTQTHHPRLDAIVWLFPEESHKPMILRLRDLGLRVFCLSDRVIAGMPDCYLFSNRCSIGTILRKDILKI